jgi:2-succinyl-6-hydroxy-2,4-cyclohexadiene-1-carboxylate synthase
MNYTINDVSYEVDILGQGAPLLLLHGFTGSKETWQPFYDQWKARNQLISIDLIGHGETASPSDTAKYTVESAAFDLSVLLNELQLEKVHLLGYSMGGRLALSFAAMFPEKVGKLILESASPGLKTEREQNARKQQDEALADQIVQHGIPWFVDRWENIPMFESQKQLPTHLQKTIREQRLKNSPLGLANSLRGMGTGVQPSWWEHLSTLSMPTLLIAGEKDEKFCGMAEEMLKRLPNAVYKRILGAGHAIHVEQREIFGKIVSGFIHEEKRFFM